MKFLKRSHAFWIALLLLAVGSVFAAVGGNILLQERQYREEGRTADGIVLTKAIERATRSGPGGSGTQTRYTVTYRFTAEDGRTFHGNQTVPVATWERLREQEPVRVQYVASAPATNRVAGESSGVIGFVFPTLGVGFAAIGIALVVRAIADAKRKARILADGTPADAIVTAVDETNFRLNRNRMWVVRYQYRDHSGRTHQGASEYMPPDRAAAWKRGDTVRVRFDAQQPAMSVWVE